MPAPRLLDVHVDEPTALVTDEDVAAVRVVGGGESEHITYGCFAATAIATLLENIYASKAAQAQSRRESGH